MQTSRLCVLLRRSCGRSKFNIAGIGTFDLFCSRDHDLDPMTFRPIYKLDPYCLEIYRICKSKLPTPRLSKVTVWQTDRQTDRQNRNYTPRRFAGGHQQWKLQNLQNAPVMVALRLRTVWQASCISIILKLCLRCYVLFHPQLYLNCISTYVLISFSHGYSSTLATKLMIKLDLTWLDCWRTAFPFHIHTSSLSSFIRLPFHPVSYTHLTLPTNREV